MSCTEIYAFDKNGNAFFYDSVKNAFLGAMAIWSILEEKYLPPYIPDYIKFCNWYYPGMNYDELVAKNGFKPTRLAPSLKKEHNPAQEIWDLVENADIPEYERIILFSTFDKILVKKENLSKVVKAFNQFEGNTNLKEQASIIEQAIKDPNIIAIGWNQNSVCLDCWENFGGYDEENKIEIPYNCLTQNKHYWLFEELEKVKV